MGSFGSEDTEIVKSHASTAPSGNTITLAAGLKYSHSTDTQVTLLDFDQIEISRASSKGGSYSIIATVDITPDEDGTTYKDSAGAVTDYYKIRYKNSIDASFSGYSAEVPATGFGDETLAGMVAAVYRQFSRVSNKIFDRKDVVTWLNEGYQLAIPKLVDLGIDLYVKYGTDGSGAKISFVTSQRSYSLPDDFLRPVAWEFTYDNVNYYLARPMDPTFDSENITYSKTSPLYFYENTKIVPRPTPTSSTGGMRPRYHYMPAKMSADDDTPDLPHGYRTLPVKYALKKAFEADNKLDIAQSYEQQFNDTIDQMLNDVQNRYPELPKSIPMFGISLDNDDHDGFQLPGM